MLRLQLKLVCFVLAVAFSNCLTEQSWSQELKKVRADYHAGGVQYSPDDPWVRSKVFQAHTGHSGFFYNCDNEECKRHSPYIHWTSNCQPLWPQRRGLLNGIRIDLDKVRRRINNGSCGYESCQGTQDCECSDCKGSTCQTCHSKSSQPAVSEPEKPPVTIRLAD